MTGGGSEVLEGYLAHSREGWITRSIQVLNQELDTIGNNPAKQRECHGKIANRPVLTNSFPSANMF